MKKIAKILSAVMALVLCLSLFSACGSEKVTAKVIEIDLTSEEYAFGVDKTQPELLEDVNEFIAEIKENGKFEEICNKYFGDGEPTAVTSAEFDAEKDQLVVATNAAFEPFEYTKGDKYYGIDMEIAALLAEHLGKELVINNMKFDSVCLSVGQQKCDIAMAGLTVKPDREEYVTFSDSYYTASQKLIVRSDDTAFDACTDAASVEEILKTFDSNTKIGVQNGTTGQFYVEGDESWGFDGFAVTCTGYDNGSLAVQDLLNGGINYVIIDAAPAKFITESINALV
ncbi:MAG: transporter substrate-binding domain-containing protein [Ruminococcaceae bacterium]|nr:transporter substrate-binding domain-containing protein [Oscillospiraceae bacterium]